MGFCDAYTNTRIQPSEECIGEKFRTDVIKFNREAFKYLLDWKIFTDSSLADAYVKHFLRTIGEGLRDCKCS